MDLDVTSPKQLNRRVFLKQLAVDLCTSEQRILFRAQYVRTLSFCFLVPLTDSISNFPVITMLLNVNHYQLIIFIYVLNAANLMLCLINCVYEWLQILRRRLRDIRSGELKALRLFDNFRNLFKWIFSKTRSLITKEIFLLKSLFGQQNIWPNNGPWAFLPYFISLVFFAFHFWFLGKKMLYYDVRSSKF